MSSMHVRESITYTVGRCVIEVSYSDITRLAIDVIVSSDDTNLSMGGGVSKAIRVAGGEEIFAEAQEHKPAVLGNVVVTSAGRLQAKAIFHGIVLYYDEKRKPQTNPDVIKAVVRKSLELCAARGAQSIAFPALATGTAGLEPERSAAAILVEIFTYLEGLPEIERIHIALDPEREVATRFYRQVEQYLAISEAVRRGERAIANAERFSPSSVASGARPERETLMQVRRELNTGMIERDADEFDSQTAPRVSQMVSATLEDFGGRVQQAIEKSGGDKSTTRLQVERLNGLIDAVRERRAHVERENIRAGETTPERTKKKAFYLEEEKELQAELDALVSKSLPLVMSLHGIRTRGKWQKDINLPLTHAGFAHKAVDYGYFSLIRFLLPCARNKQVDVFRDEYQRLGAFTATGYPSVIAHSLGSYIVTRAMARYDLRFKQVILCGAIVKEDYDWDAMIRGGFAERVLNDCGGQDIWARLARRVVVDTGQSGFTGFEKTAGGKVINRNHSEFGHSDYFYEKNYLDNWIPFLDGRLPSELSNPGETRTNRRFGLTLLIFAAIVILIYLLTR